MNKIKKNGLITGLKLGGGVGVSGGSAKSQTLSCFFKPSLIAFVENIRFYLSQIFLLKESIYNANARCVSEWVCNPLFPWSSEVVMSFYWISDDVGYIRHSVSCPEMMVKYNSDKFFRRTLFVKLSLLMICQYSKL